MSEPKESPRMGARLEDARERQRIAQRRSDSEAQLPSLADYWELQGKLHKGRHAREAARQAAFRKGWEEADARWKRERAERRANLPWALRKAWDFFDWVLGLLSGQGQ